MGKDETADRRWRSLLVERRRAAEARLTTTAQTLAQVAGFRDSAGGDDEHDPEGVPLSDEWARLRAQHEAARRELQEIDDAQSRVEAGEYGMCASCGQQILPARLEALPFARHCVACAQKEAT